ncbi:MAG: elongation factor Ts [Gammaproteobacteria bacterium]|nr:elongation factor Ts [Gammaproteobacteria bacterium]
MSTISAAQVKELRERTGAPMMECKKALLTTQGDLDEAVAVLRKTGRAKADNKAGRIAAEGAIVIAVQDKTAVMLEVNSETDFVSRDGNFTQFVQHVAELAIQPNVDSVETLASVPFDVAHTTEEARLELVAKVGENVQIRRMIKTGNAGSVGTYLHGNRIGVLVELDTENVDLARDVAMHIAASRPIVVSPDDVSPDEIAKEKEIYQAQAASSGKPQDIIDKMVVGRLRKYLDEVSLIGQPFVKDPDITVGSLLNKARAKVIAFHRFEVGEGIEKTTEDFKEAVMSQMQGS